MGIAVRAATDFRDKGRIPDGQLVQGGVWRGVQQHAIFQLGGGFVCFFVCMMYFMKNKKLKEKHLKGGLEASKGN